MSDEPTKDNTRRKPPPIVPAEFIPEMSVVPQPTPQPTMTISKTVTRKAPSLPDSTLHRDYARNRAIQSFDAAFDCLAEILKDTGASAASRIAAAKLIIDLSMDQDEVATESITQTTSMDHLSALAARPATRLPPK